MGVTRRLGRYVGLPGWMLAVVAFGSIAGLTTSNPVETAGALLAIPILTKLLWRRHEPVILLFAMLWQWLQVVMKVFYSNAQGITMGQSFGYPEIYSAYWLGLAAIIVMGLGMRMAIGAGGSVSTERLAHEAYGLSLKKIFLVYIGFLLVTGLIKGYAPGALNTIVVAVEDLRYAVVYLLFYVSAVRRAGGLFVIMVFTIEIILGSTGFFGEFKYVIFVALIVYVSLHPRLTAKSIIVTLVLVGVGAIGGAAWSEVKTDYRDYLNAGTGAQVVARPFGKRLGKMAELLTAMDGEGVSNGFDKMLRRIEYIDFFAYTQRYVPRIMPHEGGALWGAAAMHVLQPRIFFPDKKALPSDTLLTEKYTGLKLYSVHTSISIGYVGDAYIDFGVPGMFLLLFALGMVWGGIYRYFVNQSRWMLFSQGIAVAILMSAADFGTVVTKIIGGSLMGFIVGVLILKYFLPRLGKWMRRYNTQGNYGSLLSSTPERGRSDHPAK